MTMPIEGKNPEEMSDEELFDPKTLDDYVFNLPQDLPSWEVTDLGFLYTLRVVAEQRKREKRREEEQQLTDAAGEPRPRGNQ